MPGAFAADRYRVDLFPSLAFRRAYDALRATRGDRADVDYVRILQRAVGVNFFDVYLRRGWIPAFLPLPATPFEACRKFSTAASSLRSRSIVRVSPCGMRAT